MQSSCSLLHVPVTVERETKLASELKDALAFADEKLDELVLLTKALSAGGAQISQAIWKNAIVRLQALKQSDERNRSDIQHAVAAISAQQPERSRPFAERHIAQQKKWQLPLFPTTTIGSFPQSAEVRKARQLWRKGEWNNEQYADFHPRANRYLDQAAGGNRTGCSCAWRIRADRYG